VELKEAEQQSLRESERLEKEIAEVQEMKVIIILWIILNFPSRHLLVSCFKPPAAQPSLNIIMFVQKKISTMTADEYFAKHPELKKKFDDEIRNDYWGY